MTPSIVVGDDRYGGDSIDLRETTADVEAETVVGAISQCDDDPSPPVADEFPAADARAQPVDDALGVEYRGPDPGPGHATLARPADGRPSIRATLAAAARSLGHASDVDDEIADLRRSLADREPSTPTTDEQRRRVATAGVDVDRLRERVAELRGRLQARREVDAPTASLEDELAEVTRRLSEVETERVAAEQALSAAERDARPERECRRRRLRLQDRLANRRREARADLAADVADDVAAAMAAVPGEGTLASDGSDVEGDRLAVRLAAVRVADLAAPVVLSCGRFPDAATAAATLSGPVVRV